jgi:hypothetical protein
MPAQIDAFLVAEREPAASMPFAKTKPNYRNIKGKYGTAPPKSKIPNPKSKIEGPSHPRLGSLIPKLGTMPEKLFHRRRRGNESLTLAGAIQLRSERDRPGRSFRRPAGNILLHQWRTNRLIGQRCEPAGGTPAGATGTVALPFPNWIVSA